MAELIPSGAYRWRLEKKGGMRVPGVIYADRGALEKIRKDRSLEQVANVAHLPGIIERSLAMPDIHWGYGFPIGGVAAMDLDEGVISPGGVGYDINCGVRLALVNLDREEVAPHADALASALFARVPCGVGGGGDLRLNNKEMAAVLREGARWTAARGAGRAEDIERTEESGCLSLADPDAVSERAIERGRDQVGTLGSGNHFLEVGYVETVYEPEVAEVFGLREGGGTLLIHCGSRGLGHQVATDFLQAMQKPGREKIAIPDRQLACVPIRSSTGGRYLAAMSAAANFAWANRQYLLHLSREVFARLFPGSDLRLLYDVSHNIAKIETHRVGRDERRLCVHRKGATRSFPAGHPDVPEAFRRVGQPVLIPGDMRSGSYVLVGTEKAMEETFGSTCHGAGRLKSRSEAKRVVRLGDLERSLEEEGIRFRARSRGTLVEEAPEAYKEIDEVVNVVHGAGLSRKVARLRPLAVIKG
ncbi:MAG: RtcB family protein [Candidatus Eisenbacteria bacterium]|nr:RtcB family protein [Candidatus Eisenbacteria bacterium]